MTKILILRFSSIGDIVLTTPVVRCLKEQLKNVEIHYFTKPQFKVVLENNPYIDYIHVLDKPLWQKAIELKGIGFDYIIDLHNNIRTRTIKSILDVEAYSFDKLNFEKWWLVSTGINLLPDVHIVERYMQTVLHLGVVNDHIGLDYFLPKNIGVETAVFNVSDNKPYIAFAIGGQHATKKLPPERIIAVCKNIHQPVVLLGGKEDAETGDWIAKESGIHVISLCGKLSLHQSAYVVQQAQKVITHDTGLMHIAAAFQKEIISIWGNTIPGFGMYPYYGKSAKVGYKSEVLGLNCRPCSKIGYEKCPKGHFNCMMKQNLDTITRLVNKL